MDYKKKGLLKPLGFMGNKVWIFLVGTIGNAAIRAFCFNIVLAIIMKDLFNAAFEGSNRLFIRALIVSLISLLIALVIQPIFQYLAKKAQKKTMQELRLKAHSHMVELPVKHFDKEHSGGIITNLTSDIKIIEDIYENQIERISFITLLGTGSLILMLIYDYKIALYALIFEGLSFFTSIRVSRKIKATSHEGQKQKSKVNSKLIDVVSGYKTSKIYGVEDRMLNRFKDENAVLAKLENKKEILVSLINTTGFFFYTAKSLGVIVIGLYFVYTNTWDMGTLIAMFNLQNNMGIFSSLGDAIGKLQSSMAGVDKFSDLLEIPLEAQMSAKSTAPIQPTGSTEPNDAIESTGLIKGMQSTALVELKDISFSYEDKKVLDSLEIAVHKGQSIALVGKSGSGKSTLVKLLVGFYQTTEGEIYLEGKKYSQFSLNKIREKISYVPQNPYLFSGSIEDNIRLGRLDATKEDIVNAAKMANAHDFILQLKNGYETILDEGGINLSGGQRQRIAIARALLKKAQVLIFDEATAALDPDAEEAIQQTIAKIMSESTVIIIAHRLSTIQKADKIYVLDEGKVVEVGNHNQLVAKSGVYSDLFKGQTA